MPRMSPIGLSLSLSLTHTPLSHSPAAPAPALRIHHGPAQNANHARRLPLPPPLQTSAVSLLRACVLRAPALTWEHGRRSHHSARCRHPGHKHRQYVIAAAAWFRRSVWGGDVSRDSMYLYHWTRGMVADIAQLSRSLFARLVFSRASPPAGVAPPRPEAEAGLRRPTRRRLSHPGWRIG